MYDTDAARQKAASIRMPKPTGYKLLIMLPEAKESTAGGVYIPDELKSRESLASIIGYVVSMGDAAYGDERKFPTGPWCQTGQFVMFKSYSGTRFKVDGVELRLINDDTVEAVVDDPRGYERAI
jgi:chaperonin GroES